MRYGVITPGLQLHGCLERSLFDTGTFAKQEALFSQASGAVVFIFYHGVPRCPGGSQRSLQTRH